MKDTGETIQPKRRDQVWITRDAGSVDGLKRLCDRDTPAEDWPLATEIRQNTPVYDAAAITAIEGEAQRELLAEWATAFNTGPGVIVIRGAIPDAAVIDRSTELFSRIILDEKNVTARGDYFAAPGANDRVWNSLQKHCLAAPESFADYFSYPAIDLACRAWLGPGYQITAQVHRVNPGGKAQDAHRDYHLGFMTPERQEMYPGHVQLLSPMLTLQGAIAHVDMPVESGPTLYLPYSQMFFEGYVAFERPEFQDYFFANCTQLAMSKGDAVFFNPAVMHGSGTNRTKDLHRMVNLLQVSSPMGRTMESIDRTAMVKALYPVMADGRWDRDQTRRIVAASAEGYAFPTNLDTDPAVGGMSPKTQADLMNEALESGTTPADFFALMESLDTRRRA